MRLNHAMGMVIGALMTLARCSGFDRAWKAAGERPTPENAITGRWAGTWQSETSDHSGKLRAMITEQDENTYLARYHATYAGWLTFETKARLRGEQTGEGRVEFRGEEDLGWLAGGVYEYKGHATPEEFFSTYRSKHDHGTYTMTRPAAAERK